MKRLEFGQPTKSRGVAPGSAVLAVLMVVAFVAISRWLGFTADETLTFLGAALMLAGMLTVRRRN